MGNDELRKSYLLWSIFRTLRNIHMQDVYDLIDDEHFVMDLEQEELFVVFECIEDTDEVTVEEDCIIVRIPHSEMVESDDVTDLISRYYLKALEDFDEDLYSLVADRLRQAA